MGESPRDAQLGEIESLARQLADTSRAALDRVRDARSELPPQGRVVAFVHIPKTAGGTVVNMFGEAYSRRALHDAGNHIVRPDKSLLKLSRRSGKWLEWERHGGRVTAGHVPYAVYRQYLPQGTRYMTFLRDPVDRVVSHYHQHIHRQGEQLEQGALDDKKVYTDKKADKKVYTASLGEAFELGLPMITNLATRFLCGHPSSMGRLPDSALEEAKENLRDFAFVGLQERFEESIVLLQTMLRLELTPYVNRHVTVGRPLVDDLSDEDRRLILEHNRLDAELYSFGRDLFDEAVRSAHGFAADVERLEAMSREVNEEAVRRAQELLDRELPLGTSKAKAELFETARRAGVPAAALKYVSKFGVTKHGEAARRDGEDGNGDGQKIWTRTG